MHANRISNHRLLIHLVKCRDEIVHSIGFWRRWVFLSCDVNIFHFVLNRANSCWLFIVFQSIFIQRVQYHDTQHLAISYIAQNWMHLEKHIRHCELPTIFWRTIFDVSERWRRCFGVASVIYNVIPISTAYYDTSPCFERTCTTVVCKHTQ